MAITWKFRCQRRSTCTYPAWQTLELRLVVITEITAIAAEKLVTTHAGENNCYIAPGKFGNQESRYERGIRYRFVHMPKQTWQQSHHIGLHDDFPVLGAEQIGNAA